MPDLCEGRLHEAPVVTCSAVLSTKPRSVTTQGRRTSSPPGPASRRDPEGQRACRGQRRIRRACFSFTGTSWVLMALLMLMAWGGGEQRRQRSEAHQAAFPGNTTPAGQRAAQTGPVLPTQHGHKRGQALSQATRTPPPKTRAAHAAGTRSTKPPGAFRGLGDEDESLWRQEPPSGLHPACT